MPNESPSTRTRRRPLFSPGRVQATPTAVAAILAAYIGRHHESVLSAFLTKHCTGEWGILGEDDKEANRTAIRRGAAVLSIHRLKAAPGEHCPAVLWIYTEADRSRTLFSLAGEI